MAVETYTPTGIIHDTSVDFVVRSISEPVHVVAGDDQLPIIAIKTFSDGQPYVVGNDAAVNFRMKKKDGTYIYNPALGVDASRTTVYIEVTAQVSVVAGRYEPEIEIVENNKVAASSKFNLIVDNSNIEGIESTDEVKTIQAAVEGAQQVMENLPAIKAVEADLSNIDTIASNITDVNTVAENIVDIQNAEENAQAAIDSMNAAATSAQNAAASETSASGSASNASNSEQAALNAAQAAIAAADRAEQYSDVVVPQVLNDGRILWVSNSGRNVEMVLEGNRLYYRFIAS